MKLREAFLWQLHWIHQGVILIAGAILVTAISYLHTATGLAYEFHAFYIVPVLPVSWFLGALWLRAVPTGRPHPGRRTGGLPALGIQHRSAADDLYRWRLAGGRDTPFPVA